MTRTIGRLAVSEQSFMSHSTHDHYVILETNLSRQSLALVLTTQKPNTYKKHKINTIYNKHTQENTKHTKTPGL